MVTNKRQSKDLVMSLPKLMTSNNYEAQDMTLRNSMAERQSVKNMEGGLNKLLLETSMANSNDKSFDFSINKAAGQGASKSRKKHHRGRSLLEIKNEVSQRTSKVGNVIFG